MENDYVHSIPESSCFFQGHMGQFFSRKFGEYLSFKITYNESDFGQEFNTEKYIPIFSRLINRKIAQRIQDGGKFHECSPNDIKIKVLKLVDDVEEDGTCGHFKIDPPTALCTKDGCNHYFELSKGRKCDHKDTDSWEQFTFLAFCDECGRLLPLHYMTNINDDCGKCGEKHGLSKLKWTRGKDNIGSYKVICKKCHDEKGLYFDVCDHIIRNTNECLSSRPAKRFRGVPARAGAIVHPLVISIPDLAQGDNGKSESKKTQEKLFSESFVYFFGHEVEESKIYLPEFKSTMLKEENFWNLTKIQEIIEDVCDDLNISTVNYSKLNQKNFLIFINRILKDAKNRIDDGATEAKIKERYGISFIEKSLASIKEIEFGENDLQCANLLHSTNLDKKEMPKCEPIDYESWKDNFGLKKVVHYSNITMIQALLGIIEGSTRRVPVLFRTIETGKQNHKKPTVFVRTFPTEGILFQLDFKKILQWLHENRKQIGINVNVLPSIDTDAYTHLRSLILNNENCKEAVTKLLHTYSHMLIQQSTIDTGLDIQSLSEIICPYTCSIFIYSTNSINIGGLEFTYDYHLIDWFSRVRELAEDCPQDPACMVDEGGACNACSYIPEFVCCNFNQDIDRSTLVGNSDRFLKGYLQ